MIDTVGFGFRLDDDEGKMAIANIKDLVEISQNWPFPWTYRKVTTSDGNFERITHVLDCGRWHLTILDPEPVLDVWSRSLPGFLLGNNSRLLSFAGLQMAIDEFQALVAPLGIRHVFHWPLTRFDTTYDFAVPQHDSLNEQEVIDLYIRALANRTSSTRGKKPTVRYFDEASVYWKWKDIGREVKVYDKRRELASRASTSHLDTPTPLRLEIRHTGKSCNSGLSFLPKDILSRHPHITTDRIRLGDLTDPPLVYEILTTQIDNFGLNVDVDEPATFQRLLTAYPHSRQNTTLYALHCLQLDHWSYDQVGNAFKQMGFRDSAHSEFRGRLHDAQIECGEDGDTVVKGLAFPSLTDFKAEGYTPTADDLLRLHLVTRAGKGTLGLEEDEERWDTMPIIRLMRVVGEMEEQRLS